MVWIVWKYYSYFCELLSMWKCDLGFFCIYDNETIDILLSSRYLILSNREGLCENENYMYGVYSLFEVET